MLRTSAVISAELVYGPLVGRTLVASVVYHFGLPSNVLIGWGHGGLVPNEDFQLADVGGHVHGEDCDHEQEVADHGHDRPASAQAVGSQGHIHGDDCDHDHDDHDDHAIEANVWLIDSEGAHYTCPVTGNMGILDSSTPFSIIDGRKFYHCSTDCEDESEVRSALEDSFVVPGNAVGVEGDAVRFLCPVMGNEGIADATTPFSDHDGRRYYFCCPPCKPQFEASPEDYIREY